MSKVYTSIDQLIGHTPLLELTHFEADEDLKARVLVKLEYFNPAGSVKDRVAKNMIDEAEKAGKLVRGGKLRIYRDDVMICEGNVNQLKRFKDDVKEVSQGFECGISIENFNDIKIGDFIESYIIEVKPVV